MENWIISALISFVVALILAPITIKKLKQLKFGQKILEDGPTWHMSKQHTPTMGGVVFIVSTLVAIVVAFVIAQGDTFEIGIDIVLFVFASVFGIIGYIDDMAKIRKKQNAGLTALQKILLQVAAAALFVTVLRNLGMSSELVVPIVGTVIAVPWVFYLLFSIVVIVGTVNAVNLTDGIDGLASSVTMVVCLFFCATYLKTGGTLPIVFAASLFGGLLAFFLFNKFPAKVFMGDTGSLFLGGAVVGMAYAINMPLVLLVVGVVYVCEALSDILQVGYFKLSHGKRIFKMAPLHHHFEMCGWSEKKIVYIFTGITVLMSALVYVFTK